MSIINPPKMRPESINIPAYQRIKTIKRKSSKVAASKIRSHKRVNLKIEEFDISLISVKV